MLLPHRLVIHFFVHFLHEFERFIIFQIIRYATLIVAVIRGHLLFILSSFAPLLAFVGDFGVVAHIFPILNGALLSRAIIVCLDGFGQIVANVLELFHESRPRNHFRRRDLGLLNAAPDQSV